MLEWDVGVLIPRRALGGLVCWLHSRPRCGMYGTGWLLSWVSRRRGGGYRSHRSHRSYGSRGNVIRGHHRKLLRRGDGIRCRRHGHGRIVSNHRSHGGSRRVWSDCGISPWGGSHWGYRSRRKWDSCRFGGGVSADTVPVVLDFNVNHSNLSD